jgi:hypothetical protein
MVVRATCEIVQQKQMFSMTICLVSSVTPNGSCSTHRHQKDAPVELLLSALQAEVFPAPHRAPIRYSCFTLSAFLFFFAL